MTNGKNYFSCFFFFLVMLGKKHKTSYSLGKQSVTKPQLEPMCINVANTKWWNKDQEGSVQFNQLMIKGKKINAG